MMLFVPIFFVKTHCLSSYSLIICLNKMQLSLFQGFNNIITFLILFKIDIVIINLIILFYFE